MINLVHFPKTMASQQAQKDLYDELMADIARMQEAYGQLREMPDYICPIVFTDLTTKEIDSLTKSRISKVIADDTLLPTERQERIKKYKELHKDVVTCINIINKVAEKWPEARFEHDALTDNLQPTVDVHELITKKAKKKVPPKAREHATLIDGVLVAIALLREFEQENNVAKHKLEMYSHITADKLAERWVDGSIFYPYLDPNDTFYNRLREQRKILENNYL